MEQRNLLEASNKTLREDNAKLRKQLGELLEERDRVFKNLAAREAQLVSTRTQEVAARRKLESVYRAAAILADAVNGNTVAGKLAKEFARSCLTVEGLELPTSLAVRKAPKKKVARKRRIKKS